MKKSAGQIYKQSIGSVVIVSTQTGGQRGSGVVIGDNEIATNCHVVDDGSPIFIQRPGESETPFPRRFYARIVASSAHDICLLKTAEKLSAPAVKIGDSKSLDVGDTVYAIGNPNGIFGTLSDGVVAQMHPHDIQTTTALAGGSSGGGLFDAKGNLVGITTGRLGSGESAHSARRVEIIKHLQRRVQVEAPLHNDLIAALRAPTADKFRELARRIAESIDHPRAQSLAWRDIGIQETERGDKNSAEPIVEKMRVLAEAHPEYRNHILVDAVHILANRGGKGKSKKHAADIKVAQELTEQLTDNQCRTQAIAHIIREVARHDIDQARKLFECQEIPLDRIAHSSPPYLTSEIAISRAALEDSGGALRIANNVPGVLVFTETLARIGYEFEKQKVRVGSAAIFRFAMEWAVNPKAANPCSPATISDRLTALVVVAYHAANCGAHAESERALRMMVEYREKCGYDGGYASELMRKGLVAEARALRGDVAAAFRMISRIPVLGNEIVSALTISAIRLSRAKQ